MLQIEGILNIAQTHAFTVLGMSQLVHAVGMRDVNRSVFKMNHLENRYMIVAWGLGITLQVLVTEVPYFIALFKTSRLGMDEWGILGVLSCLPLVIHELLILSQKLLEMGRENETQGESSNYSEKTQQSKQHQNDSAQPGEIF